MEFPGEAWKAMHSSSAARHQAFPSYTPKRNNYDFKLSLTIPVKSHHDIMGMPSRN